jgi:uncharacterized protein (TIGR03083 family)
MQTEDRTTARIEPLHRSHAAQIAEAEVRAFRDLIAKLEEADWDRATDSAGWRVREVVAHVGGQYEELARISTFLRRLRSAHNRYSDRTVLDGHNQVQIDELGAKTPGELVARLDRFGPAGLRAVKRMPALIRRLPSTLFFPGAPLPNRSLGYLFDILTPRDTWMHRLEVARATARTFALDSHDRVIVAQVIRDLDKGWPGGPVTLELTGPAGGTWTLGVGAGTDAVRADAVEMMLHLSGRAGLGLPAASPLTNARVEF